MSVKGLLFDANFRASNWRQSIMNIQHDAVSNAEMRIFLEGQENHGIFRRRSRLTQGLQKPGTRP